MKQAKRRLAWFFGVVLYLTTVQFLHGQTQRAIQYTMADGLPSDNVYYVMKDSRGFMWFATDRGVARFDGITFEVFSLEDGLTSNDVFKILEDTKGRIWFNTFSGKPCFYQEGTIHSAVDTPWLKGLVTIDFVLLTAEDGFGNIWIMGNGGGVHQISPTNKVISWQCESVIPAMIVQGDSLFFYDRLGIQYVPDSTNGYVLRPTWEPEVDMRDIHGRFRVMSMCTTEAGWVLAVYMFEDKGYTLLGDEGHKRRDPLFELEGKQVIGFGSSDSTSVILSYHGGSDILSYNAQRDEFELEELIQLPDTKISHTIIEEGNIWASSLDKGVFYFPQSKIKSFALPDPSPAVTDLFLDHNDVLHFAGEYHRFGTWTNEALKVNTEYQSDIAFKMEYHFERNGVLLASSKHNIFSFFPDGQLEIVELGSLFLDTLSNNRMLFGTGRGILVTSYPDNFNELLEVSFTPSPYLLEGGRFTDALVVNDSIVWYLEKGKVFQLNVDKPLQGQEIEVAGIQGDWAGLDSYLASDGDHWIWGWSDRELVGISEKRDTVFLDQTFSFSDYQIKGVYPFGDSVIFVTSTDGLGVFDWDYHKGELSLRRIITPHEGMIGGDVNDLAYRNDTLFIATNRGLSVFEYHEVLDGQPQVPPIPLIKDFQVNGVAQPIGEIASANSNSNSIFIRHTGIHYPSLGNVTFRYRIIDGEWNVINSQTVHFIDLPAGNYRYEVQASTALGEWSMDVASVAFVVTKPFYNTLWFVLLVGGVVLGSASSVIWMRFRQVTQRAAHDRKASEMELRALKAQMNPHFIFNVLGSIQRYVLANNSKLANEYLTKFSRLTRMVLNHSDKLLVSLSDELQAIQYYIELEQLRLSHRFSYTIEVDPAINVDRVEIPPLFIQVFVENAVWHGLSPLPGQGKLQLVFDVHGELMKVIIRDNGIGRKMAMDRNPRHGESRGSQITMDKLVMLNDTIYQGRARIAILDLVDQVGVAIGTEVQFVFPTGPSECF